MKDLTSGSIYKTFILFAIPMVLAALLSQGYNLVDTVIAGKLLGSEGLAAIGATSDLISVISAIFWGYGTGLSMYIARLFGAREYKKIKSCICVNYLVLSGVVLLFSLLLILGHNIVFDFLQVAPEIRHDTFVYYAIYIGGMVIINLSSNGLYVMNALGMSYYPFYMSVISAILNIIGDIFAVVVLHTGVAGIAISTVLASLVVTICYVLKLRSCFKEMNVLHEKLNYKDAEFSNVIPYAIPCTTQQMIMYISSFIISPLINGIGSYATASYAVIMKIHNINASVFQNAGKTLSNYSAQCMGAKKYNRINKGIIVGLFQNILFLLPFLLSCIIFAPKVCSLFFPSGHTGEDLNISIVFIRCYMPFMFLNLVNNLFHSLFRGVKKMNLLLIATLIGSASKIIASYILSKFYGIYGIYAGWVISWLCEMIFVTIIYFTGKWKPQEMY